jgi:hypothetical protein
MVIRAESRSQTYAMASSSSSNAPSFPLITSHPVSDKLTKINAPLWRAQVLAAIGGMQLEGFLTGKTTAPAPEIDATDADGKAMKGANGKNMKIANPAYETWAAQDQ